MTCSVIALRDDYDTTTNTKNIKIPKTLCIAGHYACIQYTRYKSASLERGGVGVGGGDCITKNVFSYAFICSQHFIYHHQ